MPSPSAKTSEPACEASPRSVVGVLLHRGKDRDSDPGRLRAAQDALPVLEKTAEQVSGYEDAWNGLLASLQFSFVG